MAAEQTIHLERYAPDAKALVAGAQDLADERKHAQVEPIHLLARAIDRDAGVDAALGRLAKTGTGLAYPSGAMLALLARAEKEAGPTGTVVVEHLLNALAQE